MVELCALVIHLWSLFSLTYEVKVYIGFNASLVIIGFNFLGGKNTLSTVISQFFKRLKT